MHLPGSYGQSPLSTAPSEYVDSEPSMASGAASHLKSVEQVELLDAIDQLRRENIDADIGIPQVVVCGDQSNGKSSLLEAIAQMPFPTGDGTCTLFPTELILRNAEKRDIKISIEPSKDRSPEQRQELRAFRHEVSTLGRAEFSDLFAAASDYLKKFEPGRAFWYDRLRAEISGPDQPHLSCIDLPGLILQPLNKHNQRQEDVAKILELTNEYINKPRTVVIAVVSAGADFQTQVISQLISNSGEAKGRTLGVITKADKVTERDDCRRKIALARNEELELGLGWHVVSNVSHIDRDLSQAQRDAAEQDVFRASNWSELPARDLGIDALRQKLSQSLLNCIKEELPVLISDLEKKLSETKRTLDQLGPARQSSKDHRVYLTSIASRLRGLIDAAMRGDNMDAESDGFFDSVDAKNIRNLITRQGDEFAVTMRQQGRQFVIGNAGGVSEDGTTQLPARLKPNFSPPYTLGSYSDSLPHWAIPFIRYCEDLASWIQDNRGKDLRGLVKRDNIQAIFRQQSIYWEPLSRAHIQRCHGATLEFMRLAVKHVAGPYTGQKLMQSYVNPAFDAKYNRLEDKMSELLWPYQTCHLITDNPSWIAQTSTQSLVQPSAKELSSRSNGLPLNLVGTSWSNIALNDGYSSDLISAAQALDRAEVYYDIAISTLIDNVATLAIERCLLEDLPDIVALDDIAGLNDEQLAIIGAEPEAAREERVKANAQSAALEDVIRTCRRHVSRVPQKPVLPIPQVRSPVLTNLRDNLSTNESVENVAVAGQPIASTPNQSRRQRQQGRKSLGTVGVQQGLCTSEPSPGHRTESLIPSPAMSGSQAQNAGSVTPQGNRTSGFGRWGRSSRESSANGRSFNAAVEDSSESEL